MSRLIFRNQEQGKASKQAKKWINTKFQTPKLTKWNIGTTVLGSFIKLQQKENEIKYRWNEYHNNLKYQQKLFTQCIISTIIKRFTYMKIKMMVKIFNIYIIVYN